MASSTLALYDPELNYIPPLPQAEISDMSIETGYGDFLPFFNTFCPPYFNLDPNSLNKDHDSDGFISSAYGEEGSDYLGSNLQLEYYEGEEPPYNGHENWLTGADFIHHWQEKFFPVGNHLAQNNGDNGDSRETEEGMNQTDDQQSESYYKEEQTTHIPYAYEPLSGYWSWLENQCEEYTREYNSEQEPGASMNELGFCESIFDYWPCMSREWPRIYDEFM